MNYTHHFLIVSFLCTSLCNAMENKEQLNPIEKKLDVIGTITAVKNPYQIRSFRKDHAIVLGKSTCGLVDYTKDKEIHTISMNVDDLDLVVCPKNKRVLFINTIMAELYNVKKAKREWYREEPTVITKSAVFSPHEKALFLCYGEDKITKYNYKTKECNTIPMSHTCMTMAIHPKEKIMCIGNYLGKICLYNIDELKLDFKKEMHLPITSTAGVTLCRYSPDGSSIAVDMVGTNLSIMDLEKECMTIERLNFGPTESLEHIEFHPNGAVLATLSEYHSIFVSRLQFEKTRLLRYWDTKTKQCICKLSDKRLDGACYFTFSHDGSELIFIAKDQCFRTAVPFAVFYKFFTKDEFLYHLFVLNQIKDQGKLTGDTVYYYMKSLLERCKR